MKKGMFFAIIAAAVVMVLLTSGLSFAGDTLKVVVDKMYSNSRDYHINKVLTDDMIEVFESKENTLDPEYYRSAYGGIPKNMALAKMLFEIPGVSKIYFKRYEICIHKGAAFQWKEIHPEIMWTLKRYFGAKKLIEKEFPVN